MDEQESVRAAVGHVVLAAAQLEQLLATVHALQFDSYLEEQRRRPASRLTRELRRHAAVHAPVPDIVRTWAAEAQTLLDRRGEVVHSIASRVFDGTTGDFLQVRLSARDGRVVDSGEDVLRQVADALEALVRQGLTDVLRQVAAAQGLSAAAQGRASLAFVAGIPGGFETLGDKDGPDPQSY